jgi:predicted GH43/DUF377 family glycosyl hydrolase
MQIFVPPGTKICILDNSIFPTGAVTQVDTLLIYYSAADQTTGVLELRVRDLLESLK